MEESRLERTACAAFSCMPMTSRALTMLMGSLRQKRCRSSSARIDFFFPDQHDFYVVVTCGENGAFHFGFGRAISAHGVKSDDGRHFCLSGANLD